jgi:hypothetical protein
LTESYCSYSERIHQRCEIGNRSYANPNQVFNQKLSDSFLNFFEQKRRPESTVDLSFLEINAYFYFFQRRHFEFECKRRLVLVHLMQFRLQPLYFQQRTRVPNNINTALSAQLADNYKQLIFEIKNNLDICGQFGDEKIK